MIRRAPVLALLLACTSGNAERSGANAPPAAPAVAEQTPQPPAPLGDEEGAILFATACTSCHTGGFVQGSRISEKGWGNEITKMRKWGALVDEDQAARFATWLSKKYPVAEAPPPDPGISPAGALATAALDAAPGAQGDAQHGKELFTQACAACHGATALGTGGGPALVEHPVLQQRDRFTLLVQKGKGRMPGYDLKPGDVESLVTFLRGLGR